MTSHPCAAGRYTIQCWTNSIYRDQDIRNRIKASSKRDKMNFVSIFKRKPRLGLLT